MKLPKHRCAPSRTRPTTGSIAALNRAAKSAPASGWMAGDGSSSWMIVAPASARAVSSARRSGTNASAAERRSGIDGPGSGDEAAGQRVRPGHRHLERPGRPAHRRAVLRDDAEAVRCRDRLEHLEHVLLVVPAGAQAARRRQRPDAGHVAVELGREEAGPAHLPVGHDVDARPLLVVDRDVDGVGVHLLEIHRAELAALRRVEAGHEPRRPGVRADDAREQAARPVGGTDGLGHEGLPMVVALGAVVAVARSRGARRPAAGGAKAKARAGCR